MPLPRHLQLVAFPAHDRSGPPGLCARTMLPLDWNCIQSGACFSASTERNRDSVYFQRDQPSKAGVSTQGHDILPPAVIQLATPCLCWSHLPALQESLATRSRGNCRAPGPKSQEHCRPLQAERYLGYLQFSGPGEPASSRFKLKEEEKGRLGGAVS